MPASTGPKLDDVILGSANQAGEDNRNVARMAALLAGLPVEVPGTTINRLCASGMDAVGIAARGIRAGDYDLTIAGGVESMSRAPFVMPKAESALFPRQCGLRHHHRLALREPEDEGGLWHRLDAADRRQCRRRLRRSAAPTRTPLPRAARRAGRRRRRPGSSPTRSSPVEIAAAQGRSGASSRPTSTPAPAPPPRSWPA